MSTPRYAYRVCKDSLFVNRFLIESSTEKTITPVGRPREIRESNTHRWFDDPYELKKYLARECSIKIERANEQIAKWQKIFDATAAGKVAYYDWSKFQLPPASTGIKIEL